MKATILAAFICVILPSTVFSADAKFYPLAGAAGDAGAAGQAMLREDVKGYNDSLWKPTSGLPSPRAVSWGMTKGQGDLRYPEKRLNSRFTTAMLTYFGQMVSHDMNHRMPTNNNVPEEHVDIPIPPDDGYYRFKNVVRNFTIPRDPSTTAGNKRTAINNATAAVDLSFIYTISDRLLAKMRKNDGSGELKMDKNGMDLAPVLDVFTLADLQSDPDFALKMIEYGNFTNLRATGDARGNQNPGAISLRTIFFRNHNRLARQFRSECKNCNDEDIFSRARRWNIAIFQAITFYEYVPQLGIRLPLYTQHNPTLPLGVDNFFSTVSYRYGHSEVVDTFIRLNDNGTELPQGHLTLAESWYNPEVVFSAGVESVLRGMAVQLQGEVEPYFAVGVQQHLLGPSWVNGTDLCATNIFRAREHGLPLYNDVRKEFGLKPNTKWSDITNSTVLQQLLAQAYAPYGPDKCDPYICGLAENKLPFSHFGELFNASMVRQYLRTRDGDPLYFENTGPDGPGFTDVEINNFKSMTLRLIIMNNTQAPNAITSLPRNIWNTEGLSGLGGGTSGGSSTGGGTGGAKATGEADTLEFRQGQYVLSWELDGDFIHLTINTSSKGWIGFGIAKDANSGMLGADMVIASKESREGKWKVEDYFSTAKALVPVPDARTQGFDDVTNWEVDDSAGGRTMVKFTRPIKARDNQDLPITPNEPQPIIIAWNPDTPVFGTPHYASTREMVTIDWITGGQERQASARLRSMRQHGILMAVAFVLLFPLGALLVRGLRYHFISSNLVKAILFYCHPTVQISAAAVATWGFMIALTKLNTIKYSEVLYHHGTFGIAIMSLVYVQVILGVVRPPGSRDGTVSLPRRVWDVVHASFGRLVLLLGIANVFIGIKLYDRYADNSFGLWIALCAASVVIIAWIQQVLDRMEMLFVARHMAQLPRGDKLAPINLPSAEPSPSTTDERDQTAPFRALDTTASDAVATAASREWARKFQVTE